MRTTRRKDSKNRVLKEGESERSNGTYSFRWTDKNHKRHTIYAPTLQELRKKEDAIAKDMLDGLRVSAESLTLNDLYDRWLRLKKGLKENTFENYKYMYENFVRDLLGTMKIQKIKKSDVKAFYITMHDVRHVKPATLGNIQTVLYQIFDSAVDDDYIRKNPTKGVLKELEETYGKETEDRHSLTVAEQDLLLSWLKKPGNKYNHWYPIICTMIYTGMRIGEIGGLRWEDVDFEKNTITVDHNLIYLCSREEKSKHGGMKWVITTPKTAAGIRTIPMLPIVKEALQLEKEYQEEADIKCRQTVDGYTDWIFLNRFGCAQHQGTMNKAIRAIIRDCNDEQLQKGEKLLLPKFSCHSLRHTMATRMNEAGVNDRVRMAILGHKDLEVTQNTYTDVFAEFSAEELKKMVQE